MKIGTVSFNQKAIKKWSWKRFKEMYDTSTSMQHELNKRGYNAAKVFKLLTGKDVPKNEKPAKAD